MISRRSFLSGTGRAGLAAATLPLLGHYSSLQALAQAPQSSYKAIVVLTLVGGMDGHSLINPLDAGPLAEYMQIRGAVSLMAPYAIPLPSSSGQPTYGLHCLLSNIANMYKQKRAAVVANVGPLIRPVTKAMINANLAVAPESLLSHPVGQQQWESAQTIAAPTTGWGGRIADLMSSQSGSLPMVLNAANSSVFSVGNAVQGIVVQGGGAFTAMPAALDTAVLGIANTQTSNPNTLVAQLAKFRAISMQQQVTIEQAAAVGTVAGSFTSSELGASLLKIAQIINGRSFVGASRQIFYAEQENHDTHQGQVPTMATNFTDFDTNIAAFFTALDQMGLSDEVLVCTHSDFGRTLTSNTSLGTDHGWGNHQLILGGGIAGGKIFGAVPDPVINGDNDYTGQGVWIPTLSVTQMAAGIASWFGLNAQQVNTVFPQLANFPSGALQLV